jgi:glycosyltransferase involved in cell wall biosynthesis
MSSSRLRICFLTYRGNPRCGGQGIYTRHLTRELVALGHDVEVWSGPPYPELDAGVILRRVPSLDLWNEEHFFRTPSLKELRDPINRNEWLNTITGKFVEMHTFSRRVLRLYQQIPAAERYDIVHDNQCLGDGLAALRSLVPIVATIHHPVTVDRRLALRNAPGIRARLGALRWFSFIPAQKRVAQLLDRILTVSSAAADDIVREFGLCRERIDIVPNGVELEKFQPLPHIERQPDRILSTISADAPLKGFPFLLEALSAVRRQWPTVTLTVVGRDGRRSTRNRIRRLGLEGAVRFTGQVTTEEMVRLYAESTIAVVPSLYEGFGLPAAEAMACGVPLVSTNAGALPEVVGESGVAGVLVPPGRSDSLARQIGELLDAPERRQQMGIEGRKRVASLFTWHRAADLTTEVYRTAITARKNKVC